MQTCYTYDSTTKRLTPAPKYATIDGAAVINPTREQYARMEPPAYPLGVSTPPEPPEGKIAVPDGYANSSVPRWKQDAEDWVAHRDAVMTYALTLMNEVEAGIRPAPTMDEFKAGLPVIEWSYAE